MTRPTTVRVILALTLVATASAQIKHLNDAQAEKAHETNLGMRWGSAQDSDSAQESVSAPPPPSAPPSALVSAEDSASAKPSAPPPPPPPPAPSPPPPPSAPPSASAKASTPPPLHDFQFDFLCEWYKENPNQSNSIGECPATCTKVKFTPKIASVPSFKKPPPPPGTYATIVNVSDARKPNWSIPGLGFINWSIPGLNISPANVTEPTTEPGLDYIYHLLVTFLVVFVGFGFRIRHLMARGKTSVATPMTEEQIREYLSKTAPHWDVWDEAQRRGLVMKFYSANPSLQRLHSPV